MPKSCVFLAVARELRDIIYIHLITLGDLAILRVCQQMHDEAKDLLYQRGIFRLRLLYVSNGTSATHTKVMDPLETLPDKVQNFDIEIDVRSYSISYTERDEGLDPRYPKLIQGAGTCHVTLRYQDSPGIFVATPVLELIESLGTIKLLTLRIHLTLAFHPRDRRNESRVEPDHTRNLQSIATSLSASLGVPEWKSEPCPSLRYQMYAHSKVNPFPSAKYLVFYPQERKTSGNVSY